MFLSGPEKDEPDLFSTPITRKAAPFIFICLFSILSLKVSAITE